MTSLRFVGKDVQTGKRPVINYPQRKNARGMVEMAITKLSQAESGQRKGRDASRTKNRAAENEKKEKKREC